MSFLPNSMENPLQGKSWFISIFVSEFCVAEKLKKFL
jgi:hypothetical protein